MKNLRWIIAALIVINVSSLSAKGNITFSNELNNSSLTVNSSLADLLTVQGEAVEVQIVDMNGNVVSKYSLDTEAKKHHFDISALAAGEYKCVMINKNRETYTSTFQKS